MSIGEKIKKARENKNLTIRQLSKMINVNASYISRLERGIDKNPGLEILIKLKAFLNIDVELTEYIISSNGLSQYTTLELIQEVERRLRGGED